MFLPFSLSFLSMAHHYAHIIIIKHLYNIHPWKRALTYLKLVGKFQNKWLNFFLHHTISTHQKLYLYLLEFQSQKPFYFNWHICESYYFFFVIDFKGWWNWMSGHSEKWKKILYSNSIYVIITVILH